MRVAVVTGGASGMGLAMCRHLARRGEAVTVLDLDGAGAERAADELRGLGTGASISRARSTPFRPSSPTWSKRAGGAS
jgi:2-hydroxycyclohexanecarboxyl-CoA dehydrogenase